MNATAEKIEPTTAEIRRFNLPDLDQHGEWIMGRLLKQFGHLDRRRVITWLKGILYQPEYYFLYQEHAVALVQITNHNSLDAAPVVQERFVWAQDPKNPAHIAAAAEFYPMILAWAKFHPGVEIMIVEESSDVPHEMVRAKLSDKRVFVREQKFVRI